MIDQIRSLLHSIKHPESGVSIIDSQIVDLITYDDGAIFVTLAFKGRDPLAKSIRRAIEAVLGERFPTHSIVVTIKELSATAKPKAKEPVKYGDGKCKIIAVASGKGGVGKSTVAVNIAVTLAQMGHKVGFLDADIYGPSAPKMFGLESHTPVCSTQDENLIMPAEKFGIKVNSIGFFIKDTDALAWRGAMATNALRQLIHQSDWGELDYMICDMPPGTGDIHLTILTQMSIDGAVIVSTPHQVAIADVVRGVEMLRSENINIPILGIIENMAWFTPKELPDNRYYIFGKSGCSEYAQKEGIKILGEVPIIMALSDGGSNGSPASLIDSDTAAYYRDIVNGMIEGLK